MKKQSIWVFEWRKSAHYWWSYISFSPVCKELTSMLDPLLYRWGVPPVVIRCVHWTMQSGVLQTWIKALGLANVMGSHKMARPQQNWGLLTLLTRWASIWTMPNTASPKSEPPCGRAVYTPVRATILGHPPQKTAPGGHQATRFYTML